ncbi:MAG TPA: gamma-glutamylcyclotransferase family protein [Polyangiaceae bacterium]|nr:gamma-glutamylcyclotransferase family protein [Polyangiaceae bacterium]
MERDIALFVYGSLKLGFRHANMLAGALRVGPALAAPYTLVRYRDYPAMVAAAHGVVHGELVFVDRELLVALDEFEGCPTWYQRHGIRLVDGRAAEAYLIPAERARGYASIAEGIWRED